MDENYSIKMKDRITGGNTGLAKVAVQCSADQPRLMVNHPPDGGLRINPPAGGW
jgi:hypothetical protein